MRVRYYELALYSGHVTVYDFEGAVEYNWALPEMLCNVRGATGPCYITRVLPSVLRAVIPTIGWTCFACGRVVAEMSACSGCGFTRYCSVECQRAHWRTGHRSDCNTIAFDRLARNPTVGQDYVFYGFLSAYDFNLYNHLFSQLLG